MGMFDNVKCHFPLPVEGFEDQTFQTKDLDNLMDNYEIRKDGTLWKEDYDIEDHSEMAKWKAANPGVEPPKELTDNWFSSFCGCMARVNERWVPCSDFTGEICFYDYLDKDGWIEFSSYFVHGKINQLHLIKHEKPKEKEKSEDKTV
jgi:hypothetical protein